MSEKNNKAILLPVAIILGFIILLILLKDVRYAFALTMVVIFVWLMIAGTFEKGSSKKELYERLGVSSDDEFSIMLCEFDELINDKLYIKDELVVNINSYKCYNLYEIKNIEKIRHHHRNRTLYRDTYELKIYAETTTDTLYFDTSINARDCAYLLLSKKLTESREDTAGDDYDDLVSNETAYSEEAYDDMIMDKEDLKDIKDRSDWLGSI